MDTRSRSPFLIDLAAAIQVRATARASSSVLPGFNWQLQT
jgi:hypothetical protein